MRQHEQRLATIVRKMPDPPWKVIVVERSEESPTGFIELSTKEVIDPEEYDHMVCIQWGPE